MIFWNFVFKTEFIITRAIGKVKSAIGIYDLAKKFTNKGNISANINGEIIERKEVAKNDFTNKYFFGIL